MKLDLLKNCTICPRNCQINRHVVCGFCGGGDTPRAAKAMLHFGEEPPISGKNGSGAVFFSGCNLKCCFCQNYNISSENFGVNISVARLAEIFLELQSSGAHNINLVNPTHYIPFIVEALDCVKSQLQIPIVYNSSGYEKVETLQLLEGYVDVYLPDFKYISGELSQKYSAAADYAKFAEAAIIEMFRQTGKYIIDENNLIKKGLIIRHLILPNAYKDSLAVLERIAEIFQPEQILVSIMRQYTPFYKALDYKELNRKLTTFEYEKVIERCEKLGLNGFIQDKSSATAEMTPNFDLSGILT